MTEWESAEERNNREKINRARQAAEDLFRPPRPSADPGAASAPNEAESERQPRRQPRVFSIPPRLSLNATREAASGATPTPPTKARRRSTNAIPSSQQGRVRALTTYGMTRSQVAELYGVPVEEIDWIVENRDHKAKSR